MNEKTPSHYLQGDLPEGLTGQVNVLTPAQEQLEAARRLIADAERTLGRIQEAVTAEGEHGETLDETVDQAVAGYVGDGLRECTDDDCRTSVTSVGIVEAAKPSDQPHTAKSLNELLASGDDAAQAFEQSMNDAQQAGVDVGEVMREMDDALAEAQKTDAYGEVADSLELTGSLRQVAIDLMNNGASRESIIANGTDGLVLYESIAADMSMDEQARQRATNRVRVLYSCDGLDFGGKTFDRALLYSDTPDAERAVTSIQGLWREVVDVGYDTRIMSNQIKQDFDGRYMYNDLQRDVEARYRERADRLQREADVVRETRGETLALSRRILPHDTEQDYVLEGLVDDVDLMPAEAASRVVQAHELVDSLDELSASERTIIEQTNIFTFESARHLQQFANHLDRAKMVAGFHEQIHQLAAHGETHSLVNTIYTSVERNMDREEGALSREELEHAIHDVFAVHEAEPTWDKRTIIGMLGGLENETVREVAMDARMRDFLSKNAAEANGALGQVQFRPEVDWNSALDVYEATDQPLEELVKTILSREPKEKTSVTDYYNLLKRTTNIVDKNGIPYSTPQGIEQALQSSAYTQENMEWFLEGGDVPMIVFDTVHRFRDTLVAQGVEDTAASVYEAFCGSPELIAEESAVNLKRYVSGMEGVGEADIEGLIEAAHADAEARKDQFRIFINIDQSALRKVIENTEGSLKSIMDTDVVNRSDVGASVGVRRSANYMYHRADVEAMIGARARGDQEHPIYGSCGFVDRGDVAGARGYGDIVLSFKPGDHGLRDRTTYTPEDSFRSIHRLTEEDAAALRVVKNGTGQGFTRTNEYVEAQIVGGVNVDDVAEIFVPEEIAVQVRGILPPALLEKMVITTIGLEDKFSGDRAYDNTAEKALVERYKKGAPVESQPANPFGGMEY